MTHYDYIIIGAGIFGATAARDLTDAGKKALVIEKQPHVGGMIADRAVEHYYVCDHGGHIFHTNDSRIWDYLSRFTTFIPYRHRVAARAQGRLWSFPINLLTLAHLWGVETPEAARRKLDEATRPYAHLAAVDSVEAWCLSHIGSELYELFIRGYTAKQWRRAPSELPSSIVRRLPLRLTWDDHYFADRYEGMPSEGYSAMLARMLRGVEVVTGCDYLANWRAFEGKGRLIYSGPIDAYYDYRYGPLAYRSLRFEQATVTEDSGAATVNECDSDTPHTRTIAYQHFYGGGARQSVVTTEYPADYAAGRNEAYYPVRDSENASRYQQYRAIPTETIFGGRQGSYLYLNLDQTVAQARTLVRGLL